MEIPTITEKNSPEKQDFEVFERLPSPDPEHPFGFREDTINLFEAEYKVGFEITSDGEIWVRDISKNGEQIYWESSLEYESEKLYGDFVESLAEGLVEKIDNSGMDYTHCVYTKPCGMTVEKDSVKFGVQFYNDKTDGISVGRIENERGQIMYGSEIATGKKGELAMMFADHLMVRYADDIGNKGTNFSESNAFSEVRKVTEIISTLQDSNTETILATAIQKGRQMRHYNLLPQIVQLINERGIAYEIINSLPEILSSLSTNEQIAVLELVRFLLDYARYDGQEFSQLLVSKVKDYFNDPQIPLLTYAYCMQLVQATKDSTVDTSELDDLGWFDNFWAELAPGVEIEEVSLYDRVDHNRAPGVYVRFTKEDGTESNPRKLSFGDLVYARNLPQDQRESFLQNYELCTRALRSQIEKFFTSNFRLNKLHLPEQARFLSYVTDKTPQEILNTGLKDFISALGEEGVRSFLSIESDGEFTTEKLIAIQKQLPEQQAKKIFNKYAALVDDMRTTVQNARRYYKNLNEEDIIRIREQMLASAKDVLLQAYKAVVAGENIQELINELELLNGQAVGFAKIAKHYRGDFQSLEMHVWQKGSDRYSQEEVSVLKRIFHTSRQIYSSPKAVEVLDEQFAQLFAEGSGEKFIDFRKVLEPEESQKETILGMASYTIDHDGSVLIRSLGFAPGASSPVLAFECMQEIIDIVEEKYPDRPIKGEVQTKNRILNMYIKRFDFEIVEPYIEDFHGTGEPYYTVLRKSKNERLSEQAEG